MTRIAQRLEARGYVLRTGGGNDTDSAFEAGCAKKEVFLPWPGFNGRASAFDSVSGEALAVACAAHPAFHPLRAGIPFLHGGEEVKNGLRVMREMRQAVARLPSRALPSIPVTPFLPHVPTASALRQPSNPAG